MPPSIRRPSAKSAGVTVRRKSRLLNTDQGSQFTSVTFTGALAAAKIKISMDGRGRWMDNVFIERLWRSLKHEDIYLKGYADGREARHGIAASIAFYNSRRPHQALGYAIPMARRRRQCARRPGCGHDGQTQERCPHATAATTATADSSSG